MTPPTREALREALTGEGTGARGRRSPVEAGDLAITGRR